MSETIDIEETERNFINHTNEELLLSNRAVENLSTQIKQAKDQFNQLLGKYQAQADTLKTYMGVIRHKYNIPDEYKYSIEKGAFVPRTVPGVECIDIESNGDREDETEVWED